MFQTCRSSAVLSELLSISCVSYLGHMPLTPYLLSITSVCSAYPDQVSKVNHGFVLISPFNACCSGSCRIACRFTEAGQHLCYCNKDSGWYPEINWLIIDLTITQKCTHVVVLTQCTRLIVLTQCQFSCEIILTLHMIRKVHVCT